MPSAARLAFLAEEFREAVNTDASVQTKHLLAIQTEEDTGLVVEANAASEASRRQTLRGVIRNRFEVEAPLNSDTEDLDVGSIVTLKNDRFGLSAGKKHWVLGVEPDAKRQRITLTVWG